MEKREVSIELLQAIINYLTTKPYNEVVNLIGGLLKESNVIAPKQEKPQEKKA